MYLYNIPALPLEMDLETKVVLKKVSEANRYLGELKGIAHSVPNEMILVNTLSLQEARDSSEIENIITTQDELFQSDAQKQSYPSLASKEVYKYVQALNFGYRKIKETNLLTINQILDIQAILIENNAGIRKLPGTELKNETTGDVIYTPPQSFDEIVCMLKNLECFINDNSLSNLDPIIKMAIIHHQFESIHPFYDGNGRTGRIINILYFTKENVLDIPVLYLSRYINQNKQIYYSLLQKVRTENVWEEWILFMLEGVISTAKHTINIILEIKRIMQSQKNQIRNKLPHIYNQDLLNNIFKHPYTKISFLQNDLRKSRPTITYYLSELEKIGILKKVVYGRSNFYVNTELYEFLLNINNKKQD